MSFRKIGAAARVISSRRAAGNAKQRRPHLILSKQVAANQADVGLADFNEWPAGCVMRWMCDIETSVRDAPAQQRDVQHVPSLACTIRLVTARLLLVLAGTSGLWALWLILGGGINLRIAGRIITSNDP